MFVDESEEIFPVVDESDRLVGTAQRRQVHEQRLRHRSVHVMVFNKAGQLLIQLRGRSKDQYPLTWDISVGGHVGLDETYDEAAQRELDEELGLTGEMRFLRKTSASAQTGWEFTCLYALTTDQPPRPNAGEIEKCEFVAPEILLAEIRSGRRQITPALFRALAFYLGEEGPDSGENA
jgi:16S rRNA (adenine1518-N6/adenine1519-N6)-dimethyltransferase